MVVQKIIQRVNTQIETCLNQEKTADLSADQLRISKIALEKVQTGALLTAVLKIVNFVLKTLSKNFREIDDLFEANALAGRLIENYTQLIHDPHAQIDDAGFVYDVSFERLKNSLQGSSDKPLRIAMVGVEYAGLMKQGGLAEALEGLSSGMADLGHQVQLIFPKYSHLPEEIANGIGEPEIHRSSNGEEYRVYRKEIGKVVCQFIEHPAFDLDWDKPNIYGPDFTSQTSRFATFSSLAADLLYEQKNVDVIHLHDWHVAGVGLKLQKEHAEEWAAGEIPPVVFTFHNNQRTMQGRLSLGTYSYDPIVKGYQDQGIIDRNDNLFVRTLMQADAVTTVSPTFAVESQQVERGEGISFAVRQAARVGKLTGILNGANLERWNPLTDATLCNWKDVDTQEAMDLSYSAKTPDLIEQKNRSRVQLQKWTAKHLPDAKIDFSKPLVTYIGRFDSRQKGIDRLESAIEATLGQGGQFIVMGTDEDPMATEILNRLQGKFKDGVFFLRDFRDASGKPFYQEQIGSLVRAATDFTLIPSQFEPCGLVQFEGWQYGSLAIGANTGGLADSITAENGFLFEGDAGRAVVQALQFWQALSPEEKETKIRKVMTSVKQSDWSRAAQKYQFVYANALQRKSLRQIQTPTIEGLKHRQLSGKGITNSDEERYLSAFYLEHLDSSRLSPFYNKLPGKLRADLPSPYGKGVEFEQYKTLGSFLDGRFVMSAPRAKKVELLLTSDDEQRTRALNMSKVDGNWTVSVPNLQVGQKYQYRVNGKTIIDPYGRRHIPGKKGHYSIVSDSKQEWNDDAWIKERQRLAGKPQPMSIYEVHPTSWKKRDGRPLNYREIAHELLAHCKTNHYTHVELMGILEYPRDISWGYQVSGYFAPTSRMGSIDDFKYLVNLLHENKIGVFLDFVPAHFASEAKFDYNARGLSYFFSVRNWFFKYSSPHFDYQRKDVRDFLISSAMYWIKEMHIDGLRVDCVRSILSSEDPESAHLFLRDLNATIHSQGQGAISMAEEFSGDQRVTASPSKGGFDFDMKWHAGFMHYMFLYFNNPHNKNHYDALQNGIHCDNAHKQILFISHDQAKDYFKMLNKIKDPAKKEALARAIYSFIACLPGKKLHFMAAEGIVHANWSDYVLRKDHGWFDEHAVDPKFSAMTAKLNQLYQTESAFHEFDSNGEDLEWIPDVHQQIHAYRRKNSQGESFLCMHNFTAQERLVPLQDVHEIFNSDAAEFGGADRVNPQTSGDFKIPPLATLILKENAWV